MNYVGIDVSSEKNSVVLRQNGQNTKALVYANDVKGHKALIKKLKKRRCQWRVCLEATGIYHFDLAVRLSDASNIEVMVVNPRMSKHFAEVLHTKNKTDSVDAAMLAEYAERMEFCAWKKPSEAYSRLRFFNSA